MQAPDGKLQAQANGTGAGQWYRCRPRVQVQANGTDAGQRPGARSLQRAEPTVQPLGHLPCGPYVPRGGGPPYGLMGAALQQALELLHHYHMPLLCAVRLMLCLFSVFLSHAQKYSKPLWELLVLPRYISLLIASPPKKKTTHNTTKQFTAVGRHQKGH